MNFKNNEPTNNSKFEFEATYESKNQKTTGYIINPSKSDLEKAFDILNMDPEGKTMGVRYGFFMDKAGRYFSAVWPFEIYHDEMKMNFWRQDFNWAKMLNVRSAGALFDQKDKSGRILNPTQFSNIKINELMEILSKPLSDEEIGYGFTR